MTGNASGSKVYLMTLEEWVIRHGYGSISYLSRRSGVSTETLHRMLRGHKLRNTRKARAVSVATDRKVGTLELLELDNEDLVPFVRHR